MKRKKFVQAFFFLMVMLLTFYAVFSKNDIGAIFYAVKGLDPLFVFFAVAAAVFFVSAEGFMIWFLLRSFGGRTGLARCIGYSFIGFFFSGITPSATGGQPAQLYYMKKDHNDLGGGTLVLMTVAVLYKLVLVLIGVFLLLFWGDGLAACLGRYMGLFYFGIFLNVLLVILLLLVMFHGRFMERLILGAERFLTRLHVLQPGTDEGAHRREAIHRMIGDYQEMFSFLLKHKGKIVFVTACTFLQRVSLFFMTWLIYRGFDLTGSSMFAVMAIQASVYIAVDMLPLPGSQGISELMYQAVFPQIFPAGYLAASMCVTRGIGFYLLLVMGGIITLLHFLPTQGWKRSPVAHKIS